MIWVFIFGFAILILLGASFFMAFKGLVIDPLSDFNGDDQHDFNSSLYHFNDYSVWGRFLLASTWINTGAFNKRQINKNPVEVGRV